MLLAQFSLRWEGYFSPLESGSPGQMVFGIVFQKNQTFVNHFAPGGAIMTYWSIRGGVRECWNSAENGQLIVIWCGQIAGLSTFYPSLCALDNNWLSFWHLRCIFWNFALFDTSRFELRLRGSPRSKSTVTAKARFFKELSNLHLPKKQKLKNFRLWRKIWIEWSGYGFNGNGRK